MKILFLAIFSISSGNTLNVKCNFVTDTVDVSLGTYYCQNAIINPTAEQLVVDGVELVAAVNEFGDKVYGTHLEGKTDDSVQAFVVINHKQHQIPEHLSRVFKNLAWLAFVGTGFKSITASDLKPFPQLTTLQIVDGKVMALESDLFKHTPNLQVIEFTRNEITYIGNDIFNNLPVLRELRLEKNPCIDKIASTIEEVLLVAPQLNGLCIQGMCAAVPTTTVEPTACPCTDQVEALNQANALNTQLKNTIAEKEALSSELRNAIEKKDATIGDLQVTNATLASELENIKVEKDTSITELRNQVAEKERIIAEKQAVVATKDVANQRMHDQVSQVEGSVKYLQKTIAEKKQKIQDLKVLLKLKL